MKGNKFNLDFDGTTIYINVKSKISLNSRIFLVSCNLLLFSLMGIAVFEQIPALMFGTFMLMGFLLRYTIWNIYGQETLVINTRIIAYRKIYLFYKTKLTTKRVGDKINVISYQVHGNRENKLVKVIFETYHMHNAPENIYEFVLPISTEDAEMISYMVSLLYLNKVTFNIKDLKFNLN